MCLMVYIWSQDNLVLKFLKTQVDLELVAIKVSIYKLFWVYLLFASLFWSGVGGSRTYSMLCYIQYFVVVFIASLGDPQNACEGMCAIHITNVRRFMLVIVQSCCDLQ